MPKRLKLNLDELKVQSFVTSLKADSKKIIGGEDVTSASPACEITCITCIGPTCALTACFVTRCGTCNTGTPCAHC